MRIAVTGMGIICAAGLNCEEVAASLVEHRSGVGAPRYLDTTLKDLPVGEVKLDNCAMKRMLGTAEGEEVSRTVLMGRMAVREALNSAALRSAKEGGLRMALVNGTTVGGMDLTEQHVTELKEGVGGNYAHSHDCGSSTELIADHFKSGEKSLFSEVACVSTACSSAANAIMVGAELLLRGEAQIVVAGGSEALSKFHMNGFNSLMILSQEMCRPFCAERNGLNLGEGAAYLVMESEENAQRRGAGIRAYLSGYGNACDAFHQTASSENGEGACLAMSAALSMASLKPSDISYINAHGTGTPNNDRSESAAILRVFGSTTPPFSSTKPFTGHATSAGGSMEAVISLLAMQKGFVPVNLGFRKLMEGGMEPNLEDAPARLLHVMSNSFGFGGADSSLIFSAIPCHEFEETGCGSSHKTYGCGSQTGSCGTDAADWFEGLKVLAKVERETPVSPGELAEFVKPMEARRLCSLLRTSLYTGLKALKEAGVSSPCGIVTGTVWGCLENSEKLLLPLHEEGEVAQSPTLFMQSTHNTISGNLAIKTGCHGYNITYSSGRNTENLVMRHAGWLLRSGKCKYVLASCHDESTPLFRHLTGKPEGNIHSVSYVLTL